MNENDPDTWPVFLTIEEAATIIRVARSTAYEMAADGTLPTVSFGGRSIRIPRNVLAALAGEARIRIESHPVLTLAQRIAYVRRHVPTDWHHDFDTALREATTIALTRGDYAELDDVVEQWWRAARLEHHGGEGWQRQKQLIQEGRWEDLLRDSEPVDIAAMQRDSQP